MEEIYPLSFSFLSSPGRRRLLDKSGRGGGPERIPCLLEEEAGLPEFLPALARAEWARHRVASSEAVFPPEADDFQLNPTLEVVQTSWKLSPILDRRGEEGITAPETGEEWLLIRKDPATRETVATPASLDELLAVKILAEDISPEAAAAEAKVAAGKIDRALWTAAKTGILIAPRSRVTRSFPPPEAGGKERFQKVDVFTIQWHITHACDLHCRHCYDRSKRSPLTLIQGKRLLGELEDFCRERNVRGHVCFTGGNPFLSPHFFHLYREAADRGFSTSILGNPVSRRKLREIKEIQVPGYFQVSLEGLAEHNDWMRGFGHFQRILDFLEVLKETGISSAVMLTLTKDNLEQVLPLARILEGKTDYFTFNRLSPVGEGADLLLPERKEYIEFLKKYVSAFPEIAPLGYKDNLINIILENRGLKLFAGCTGYGCGAAFNFITILPDGEAHACRKFPSPIGNVLKSGIAGVYDSGEAERYRRGPEECRRCSLRPVCGGCLAIAAGLGRDIFRDRDPFCFYRSGAGAAGRSR
ncbi:MAG: thio(seleno)oxazole modification radical SAM maturase SbtM [Candidatus Erginobacter occultus]|nr:thio(seleno)oxazole modification radical SAM maturase SbtM [Candidatus Erginobacter occultus]